MFHEKITQKLKDESALLKKEFQQNIVVNVVTALGVVAALAWNDAIQGVIKYYFPFDNSSVGAKLLYAMIVTTGVVLVTVYLTRLFGKK